MSLSPAPTDVPSSVKSAVRAIVFFLSVVFCLFLFGFSAMTDIVRLAAMGFIR